MRKKVKGWRKKSIPSSKSHAFPAGRFCIVTCIIQFWIAECSATAVKHFSDKRVHYPLGYYLLLFFFFSFFFLGGGGREGKMSINTLQSDPLASRSTYARSPLPLSQENWQKLKYRMCFVKLSGNGNHWFLIKITSFPAVLVRTFPRQTTLQVPPFQKKWEHAYAAPYVLKWGGGGVCNILRLTFWVIFSIQFPLNINPLSVTL